MANADFYNPDAYSEEEKTEYEVACSRADFVDPQMMTSQQFAEVTVSAIETNEPVLHKIYGQDLTGAALYGTQAMLFLERVWAADEAVDKYPVEAQPGREVKFKLQLKPEQPALELKVPLNGRGIGVDQESFAGLKPSKDFGSGLEAFASRISQYAFTRIHTIKHGCANHEVFLEKLQQAVAQDRQNTAAFLGAVDIYRLYQSADQDLKLQSSLCQKLFVRSIYNSDLPSVYSKDAEAYAHSQEPLYAVMIKGKLPYSLLTFFKEHDCRLGLVSGRDADLKLLGDSVLMPAPAFKEFLAHDHFSSLLFKEQPGQTHLEVYRVSAGPRGLFDRVDACDPDKPQLQPINADFKDLQQDAPKLAALRELVSVQAEQAAKVRAQQPLARPDCWAVTKNAQLRRKLTAAGAEEKHGALALTAAVTAKVQLSAAEQKELACYPTLADALHGTHKLAAKARTAALGQSAAKDAVKTEKKAHTRR